MVGTSKQLQRASTLALRKLSILVGAAASLVKDVETPNRTLTDVEAPVISAIHVFSWILCKVANNNDTNLAVPKRNYAFTEPHKHSTSDMSGVLT